jgi:hypothetical protein
VQRYQDQARSGAAPDPELKRTGQLFETLTNVSIVGCALSGAAALTLYFVEGASHADPSSDPNSDPSSPDALQVGLTPTGAYLRASI